LAARAVLHLIETGGPGGAERMMVHLAAGLGPEYRSEAALIRDSWLGTALRERGVPVTMLRDGHHGSLGTLQDLLRIIRETRVAILHSHEFFMNTLGLVASGMTGVPLVATVHGRNYYADRFRRRAAYRLVARLARMVAVSEDVRLFLADRIGISHSRITVIPNGVPLNHAPCDKRTSALRESLDLHQRNHVVGVVGSLYPVKGHRYLIEGSPQVIDRFPHVVFLIVGRGGLREELEAHTRQLGVASHFRFLGHRDDVSDILAICDIFVLPSLSEGMPLALLEAMAAGIPIVATKVGGVPEVIKDGETGILVPPGDGHILAMSIVRLLEDRPFAGKMGTTARESVAHRFSLTRMVQTYQQIYAQLISKSEQGLQH